MYCSKYQALFNLWIIALLTLYFPQTILGKPRGGRLRVDLELSKNSSVVGKTKNATDHTQRLCLARLREALKVACSGSGRMPLYFDPSHFYNKSQSLVGIETHPANDFKNLRNDISIMTTATRQQRLFRRRSRRNIVRECCYRSCTPTNLRKYCSSSIRYSPAFGENSQNIRQNINLPTSGLIRKDNPVYANKVAFLQDDTNFILSDSLSSNDTLEHKLTTSSQKSDPNIPTDNQCVTLSDLQNFYNSLLQGAWRKEAGEMDENHFESLPHADEDSVIQPDGNNLNAVNAYAVATNEMHPKLEDLLYQIVAFKKYRSVWQPPLNVTAPLNKAVPVAEMRPVETAESKRTEAIESSSSQHHSANAYTLKPPAIFINVPKGTNDYFY